MTRIHCLISVLLIVAQALSPRSVAERYVAALGGEAALRLVKTRTTTGRFDNGRGLSATFLMLEKAPNSRVTFIGAAPIEAPDGSGRGYDGTTGWDKNFVGTGLRTVTGTELRDLARESDLIAPLHLLRDCPSAVAAPSGDANVLTCQDDDGRVRKYAFDQKTDLLARYETEVPGRRGPFLVTYDDYRGIDGVRLPFKWVIRVGGAEITYTADSIRHNLPIEDAVFSRPVR